MFEGQQFQDALRHDFNVFIAQQMQRFPADEIVRIDLHCHDQNSDVSDERLGRLLRCPETWLPTDKLLSALRKAGTDAVTITNHNNARSCWELLDRGIDVLVGAEFTCTMPEENARFHVLTYGFTPADEEKLNLLRKNIYAFRDYTLERNLPAILAHPLYFDSAQVDPSLRIIEKLTLLFDNFEVVNGQRHTWQNMLIAAWIESLTPEVIDAMATRLEFAADRFSLRPYKKSATGGSDCHTGLFAGQTGTIVRVPKAALATSKKPISRLALDALQRGETAPYGRFTEDERMTASLLDFFCEASIKLEDPGLVRMMLHQGKTQEKILALIIANGLMELRRHRYTIKFLQTARDALHGKRPGFLIRRMTSKAYRPIIAELDRLAQSGQSSQGRYAAGKLNEAIVTIVHDISEILAERVAKNVTKNSSVHSDRDLSAAQALQKLELPAHLRNLFNPRQEDFNSAIQAINLTEWSDGLPFPLLACLVIIGTSFAANYVLNDKRNMLNQLAKRCGRYEHPKRALWLTDTFFDDRNGVAHFLRLLYDEVRKQDLPIDFACASSKAQSSGHLVVLSPLAEFPAPYYENQTIRVFDPMELKQVFQRGGYDRIVCSTELLTGLGGLMLKKEFGVPAYFYLHTDWIDFASRTLKLETDVLDRLRRIMRTFYRMFDGMFVLNRDQLDWLSSESMGIPQDRLYHTAHWIDPLFKPRPFNRQELFLCSTDADPILLYAGRVSEEKGVMELPEILGCVRQTIPNAKLAVAGLGPALEKLRATVPDGIYFGWLDRPQLANVYCGADVLVLPSKFDTFGNVVLEAMACGLPAVGYDVKGPKDIIQHGQSGYLVETMASFASSVANLLSDDQLRRTMSQAARERALDYDVDEIVSQLVSDLGFADQIFLRQQSVSTPRIA